jgi:hypothetical protein
LVLTIVGRLLVSAGAPLVGRFLYSDPASFLFRLLAMSHLHLPAHVGGVLALIWTTLFWTLFVWLIHRIMH